MERTKRKTAAFEAAGFRTARPIYGLLAGAAFLCPAALLARAAFPPGPALPGGAALLAGDLDAPHLPAAAAPAGIVREDWYFRETTRAIRDWERVLAKGDSALPEGNDPPTFPVPTDGEPVSWPNPIPRLLLPPGEVPEEVRVRLEGDRVAVARVAQARTAPAGIAPARTAAAGGAPGDARVPRPAQNPAPENRSPENVPPERLSTETLPTERLPTERLVAAGSAVLGYQHPGGGDKDRWYHAYHRRFDRLTRFRPRPAPLALRIDLPGDLGLGANRLAVGVRNAGEEPLSVRLEATFISPGDRRVAASEGIALAAGETARREIPLELRRAGGGVLVLEVACGSETFRVPLLTHVEDVEGVLDAIERILDDADRHSDDRHPAARARLSELRRSAREMLQRPEEGNREAADAAVGGTAGGTAGETAGETAGGTAGLAHDAAASWRGLFASASALRDSLLLARVDFETLIFVKRKPYDSEQPFMDAHHLINPPGGGIWRLSPVGPSGRAEPLVDSLGEGIYRDVCLHWDARKLLFSFGNGSDRWDGSQSYHIYEVDVDGSSLRQLTFGPKNDCEPFYLPSGQIGFTSDRSEHFVMCGGDRHAPNLFVMEADGSNPRQLSFNVFNDFNPTMLPDGRILYSRWEYNERSVTSLHNPFTMNPDGTMVAPYYGNATIRPNVVMFPRPVPSSDVIMALFTAHHGQTHGPIGLIDIKRGMDGDAPITILTPGVPVTGEKAEDSALGWYSDPVPLSETTYLASYTPTVVPWRERAWALYVGDRHGNLALLHRDPEISCAEPVPLVPRPRPHATRSAPPATDAADATASLVMLDVYVGLDGVPRGAARHLRIIEDLPRKGVLHGGVITTSGTQIYTVKRILGTVPVEPDGSAYFVVPANRNVYFEVLDSDRREIQRMRSVVCLKPAEERSCVGCHEPRTMSPPNRPPLAVRRDPSVPEPPPWGTRTLSFLRDVQPILSASCVGCHAHDRVSSGVILTDDLTDRFTVGYEELLPFLSVADAMRWDHPDDVLPRPPYTYGSRVSPLMRLLDDGHHGVELSAADLETLAIWVDANGVYYDRYETRDGHDRRIFVGAVAKTLEDVHARRCRSCHGEGDGSGDTWWRSLDWRDPASSRMLRAPLGRDAGGWGRCGEPVFADRSDPDYRLALGALTTLAESLAANPRADISSVRGTPAESRIVELPPPPEGPSLRPQEALEPGWTALSGLPWTSARSGWSPSGDGLPRRDATIEGHALRLGARRFSTGIGTHAPSEIAYRLDGRYARFAATIVAGEAGGSVAFRVLGDGEVLFESGVLRGPKGLQEVDVPLAGAKELRLVVTDAGDGNHCDVATWAGARLLAAEE